MSFVAKKAKLSLQKAPLEVFVIIFPSLAIIGGGGLAGVRQSRGLSAALGQFLAFALHVARHDALINAAFMAMLGCAMVALVGAVIVAADHGAKATAELKPRAGIILGQGALIFATIFLLALAVSCAAQALDAWSSRARVMDLSARFMNLDKRIFGVYPGFYLQKHASGFCDWLLVRSYRGLWMLYMAIFVALFFLRPQAFRKFLVAMWLAFLIGLVFWCVLPATSPWGMYVRNIFAIRVPSAIAAEVSALAPTPRTLAMNQRLDSMLIRPDNSLVDVTNFPSMHVAWGLIVTWFFIAEFPWSALPLVPWLLGEICATVYLLRHFAIDTLFGIVVGIVAIMAARRLFKMESRQYPGGRFVEFFAVWRQAVAGIFLG